MSSNPRCTLERARVVCTLPLRGVELMTGGQEAVWCIEIKGGDPRLARRIEYERGHPIRVQRGPCDEVLANAAPILSMQMQKIDGHDRIVADFAPGPDKSLYLMCASAMVALQQPNFIGPDDHGSDPDRLYGEEFFIHTWTDSTNTGEATRSHVVTIDGDFFDALKPWVTSFTRRG